MADRLKKGRASGSTKKTGSGSAAQPKETAPEASIKPSTLIRKALLGIASRIESDDLKASVSDLIRLLQLQQELDEEAPKEITVTWVEAPEKPSGK